MLTGELRSKIDKVWEAFWTGGLANPITVIEQMTFLLFVRRLDEIHTQREQKASFTKKKIDNPIYAPEQNELRWSYFKNTDPDVMYRLFTKEHGVFDFLKNMGATDSAFSKYMKGATFMIPTPRLLSQVVDMLSEINMEDRDTKGDVYEYLLSKIASAGQNGQFRTPRHIIKMMVQMMKPTTEDIICDPSAGTCGFIVAAGEYLRENYSKELLKPDVQKRFQEQMFMGMEFDPTMIRIGAMNLMLHGIEQPNLIAVDALSESNNSFTEKATLVLANPPFKGSLDRESVDPKLLNIIDSKKTELLFLGLILKGLQVGGRAAVIVPDGVLFGNSNAHKTIRKTIIDRHKLEGVISMPSGVFKPYAGVSTAVLIFTKTDSGGTDNVWFYDMTADGLSLDDKRNEITDNDIPDIISRWHNRKNEKNRRRTDKSFFVPVKEIQDQNYDLSINRYKEVVYEQKLYDKPEVIIQQIEQLDKERYTLLSDLKKMLITEEHLSLAAEPKEAYGTKKSATASQYTEDEYKALADNLSRFIYKNWINQYFDLVKRLLKDYSITNDDERIAFNESFTLNFGGRNVLQPLIYESIACAVTPEFKEKKYGGELFENYTMNSVVEAKLINLKFPTGEQFPEKVYESLYDVCLNQMRRVTRSRYRKFHYPLLFDFTMDDNVRKKVLSHINLMVL